MTAEPGYTPPDVSLVGAEHVRRYQETDGAVGHEWNGVPTLVLTTTGRRSGEPRDSAMIYGQDGSAYVVIASQAGLPTHPNWYHNLTSDPSVRIQVGPDRMDATARTATGAERERLWKLMTGIWPNFDVYQTRTDRVIPVVVLEPRRTEPAR
jgi:deazaflavin-dependent oxidoreductase (nitroreductase family)